MKFAYTRRGGPWLSWANGYPPPQARGADAKSLGNYEYVPTYALPGAPEVIHGITDSLTSIQSAAGMAVGAYHGYKRTGSIGWAAVWGIAGNIFPLATGAVAVLQGFAKKKGTAGTSFTINPSDGGWRKRKRRSKPLPPPPPSMRHEFGKPRPGPKSKRPPPPIKR